MSYSSSLSIEELTAAGTGSPRSLFLIGAGLPLMGAEWGTENNLVTTWYNANGDEGSQQVLGPRELPSNWSGEWHRTTLVKAPSLYTDEDGTGIPLIRPMDMVNAMETIARGGQRLRVTWNVSSTSGNPDEEGSIVREGRAKNFKYQVTRVQDINWNVEFHWVSRGQTTQKVAATRASTVVGDTGALQNKLNHLIALNTIASFQKLNPKSLTLGQLEQIASYPTKLATNLARQVEQVTSTVNQVVSIAKTLADQPTHVANAIVNQAHNVISQANNFVDSMGRVPIELMSTRARVDSTLRAASVFGHQSDAASDISVAAADLAQRLQQQLLATPLSGAVGARHLTGPGAIVGTYICKQGDTPQRISQRFYQSPDHAIDILRANRLPFHQPTFTVGKILIIPELSSSGPGAAGSSGA